MTRDHALIDELLAARALDGLDAGDAALLERELAAHGDCEECRRLEIEHAEVAGMLALALDPRPVREDMADRILARRAGPPPHRSNASRPGGTPGSVGGRPPSASRRRSRSSSRSCWRPATAEVPASPDPRSWRSRARPRASWPCPTRPESPAPSCGRPACPIPGPGKVYELWMIEDGEPVRGACLAPERGAVAAFLDADPSSADLHGRHRGIPGVPRRSDDRPGLHRGARTPSRSPRGGGSSPVSRFPSPPRAPRGGPSAGCRRDRRSPPPPPGRSGPSPGTNPTTRPRARPPRWRPARERSRSPNPGSSRSRGRRGRGSPRILPCSYWSGRMPIPTRFCRWIRSKDSARTNRTPRRAGPFAAQSRDDPLPYSLPARTPSGVPSSAYRTAAS